MIASIQSSAVYSSVLYYSAALFFTGAHMRSYSFIALWWTYTACVACLLYTSNWVTFVFLWEALSVLSFAMIWRTEAINALMVNACGGALLFVCMFAPENVASMCIVVAILIKSSQWPFSRWLHEVAVAPSYLSALLHAATLVQCGLFLLCKLTVPLNVYAQAVMCVAAYITSLRCLQAYTGKSLVVAATQVFISCVMIEYSLYGISAENMLHKLIMHMSYKPALFLLITERLNTLTGSIGLAHSIYMICHYSDRWCYLPSVVMGWRLLRSFIERRWSESNRDVLRDIRTLLLALYWPYFALSYVSGFVTGLALFLPKMIIDGALLLYSLCFWPVLIGIWAYACNIGSLSTLAVAMMLSVNLHHVLPMIAALRLSALNFPSVFIQIPSAIRRYTLHVGTCVRKWLACDALRVSCVAISLILLLCKWRAPYFSWYGVVLLCVAGVSIWRPRFLLPSVLWLGGCATTCMGCMGASDVMITQIVVDSVCVLYFMSVSVRDARVRYVDLIISCMCGVAVYMHLGGFPQVLPVVNFATHPVNTVVADKRALDTLGEMCVMAIAGMQCMSRIARQTAVCTACIERESLMKRFWGVDVMQQTVFAISIVYLARSGIIETIVAAVVVMMRYKQLDARNPFMMSVCAFMLCNPHGHSGGFAAGVIWGILAYLYDARFGVAVQCTDKRIYTHMYTHTYAVPLIYLAACVVYGFYSPCLGAALRVGCFESCVAWIVSLATCALLRARRPCARL